MPNRIAATAGKNTDFSIRCLLQTATLHLTVLVVIGELEAEDVIHELDRNVVAKKNHLLT